MNINKKLEEMLENINTMIEAIAKDKSPEIKSVVDKLAEVDVKLKHAIEELEKLDENDVEVHNELTKKLDKLLDEVVEEATEEEKPLEESQEPEEPEKKKEPKHIVIHVKGVVMRQMPIPFPFPFFW